MRVYNAGQAEESLKSIEKLGIRDTIHQIMQSFIEGICGRAFIHKKSCAIVVFDFVQCFGPFDGEIYSQFLQIEEAHIIDPPEDWSRDIVANTMVNEEIPRQGFGYTAHLGRKIIGGIGCYTLYHRGIEVEIDTHEEYRRQGVTEILAKHMIKECLERNLDCHWDAMNRASAFLAEKLGFIPLKEYTCLQLNRE